VKGLAFGADRLVAAVPTLAGLAWNARNHAEFLIPVLDARRGELYAAAYAVCDGGLETRLAEGVFQPEELAQCLAALPAPSPASWRLVGEGLEVHAEALTAALPAGVGPAPASTHRPRAASIAALGQRMLARAEGRPAGEVVPRYVRRAEAEVVRTGRRFEGPEPTPPAGRSL
jgi:tRNA threonylcarbamoyladenosine biosynthesis protein TsaB